MEAWIDYIETTGRVHTDFARDVIRNDHGILYKLDTTGRHIFRPYSRIVATSSTELIPFENNPKSEGQEQEQWDGQR
jgi:hypothetical protein